MFAVVHPMGFFGRALRCGSDWGSPAPNNAEPVVCATGSTKTTCTSLVCAGQRHTRQAGESVPPSARQSTSLRSISVRPRRARRSTVPAADGVPTCGAGLCVSCASPSLSRAEHRTLLCPCGCSVPHAWSTCLHRLSARPCAVWSCAGGACADGRNGSPPEGRCRRTCMGADLAECRSCSSERGALGQTGRDAKRHA